MKIKTVELIGAALDWAVMQCEHPNNSVAFFLQQRNRDLRGFDRNHTGDFRYSERWDQGGPIIERERISIEPFNNAGKWSAFKFDTGDCEIAANTPLVAAMRCYVASKLGDEVDVPDELMS